MTTLLAAGVLQRFGDIIVAGSVLVLALFGYQNGLFLAVLAGMHALVSLVTALAFAEPLAALLAAFEIPTAYAFPAAFGMLLVGAAVLIRLAVGGYVPADVVRFSPSIDKLGGGLIGAVAGVIVAGTALLALSIAPVPETFRIDGEKLRYDMGARMLRTFARCAEPDEKKRQILLDGEPGSVPPPAPPPRPLFQDDQGDAPHESDVARGSEGDRTGADEGGQQDRRSRQRKNKAETEKPAPPPPPPPPPRWSEPFADTNGNKSYDEGEAFLDTDGNGAFTPGLVLNDPNGNGRRDVGLLERYRMHAWGSQVISTMAVVEPPAAAARPRPAVEPPRSPPKK